MTGTCPSRPSVPEIVCRRSQPCHCRWGNPLRASPDIASGGGVSWSHNHRRGGAFTMECGGDLREMQFGVIPIDDLATGKELARRQVPDVGAPSPSTTASWTCSSGAAAPWPTWLRRRQPVRPDAPRRLCPCPPRSGGGLLYSSFQPSSRMCTLPPSITAPKS
jgi:hypothetical protein